MVLLGQGMDNLVYDVNGALVVRFSKEPDPARRAELISSLEDLAYCNRTGISAYTDKSLTALHWLFPTTGVTLPSPASRPSRVPRMSQSGGNPVRLSW